MYIWLCGLALLTLFLTNLYSMSKESLIQDLVTSGKYTSWSELAKKHNLISAESARAFWNFHKRVNKAQKKAEVANYIAALEERVVSLEEDIKSNTGVLQYQSLAEIKTLDELIEKTNIDVKTWKIDRYVQNYWGNSDTPHWQVKAFLSKRSLDSDMSLQKDYIMKLITEEVGDWRDLHRSQVIPQHSVGREYLLEISIPDLHLGKLAWGKESGEDYDIDIAVNRYAWAIGSLLSRVPLDKVGKIVLPIGNDLIHVDNAENTTTAGTPQDTDGRFAKIVRTARDLIVNSIENLKHIAPVEVIVVRGNHDSTSTLLLGEVIEAWFHADPLVKVDNSPKWRKYYQYGKVGVQLTHGDKENHNELGLIFATEEPLIWATSEFRFCKLGHLHKTKKLNYVSVDSHQGFQIEILPSLSGTDEWHSSKGYLSNKQAKAFLYHGEEGEIAEYTCTV